jgi:mono/diheme cytochrome c family protein
MDAARCLEGILSRLWLLAILASLAFSTAHAAEPTVSADHAAKMAKGLALFRDSVRGVLVAHCVECHGGEHTESEFDLTTREGLLAGGSSGEVVVSGAAEESLLLDLISHKQEPEMPAEASKLKDDQIAAIAEWIDLGAPYDQPLVDKAEVEVPWTERKIADEAREYWAFQPLAKVEPPSVKDTKSSLGAIDRFLVNRLEDKGLAHNSPADRRDLIRRAYFDLTGLPPTPEEVDAFVQDKSPDAYSKLIDRLLASPAYGERWARHWLDLARFGESDGFEQDYDRKHAYHYRDFVIKALNEDMPYDQFMRWQLAGDEIAPHNPLAMMATGFLGAGVFPTQITEKEFEPVRYDEMDDMLSTTTIAMLGMSVGCARCHDHKFDPIPQADYYRMLSTFTKTIRSEHAVELPAEGDLAAFEKRRGELADARAAYEKTELPKKLSEWLTSQDENAPAEISQGTWQRPQIISAKSSGGAEMKALDDGSILVTGNNAPNDEYLVTLSTTAPQIAAVRLEALTHDSLRAGGPGRATNGNFCLSEFSAVAEPLGGGKSAPVALANPRATHQQNTGFLSVAAAIKANPRGGWAVDLGGIGKSQAAAFDFAKPIGFDGGTKLTFTLKFLHNTQHSIGRLRISLAAKPDLAPAVDAIDGKPADPVGPQKLLAAARAGGLDSLEPAEQRELLHWFKPQDAAWQALDKSLADHLNTRPPGAKVVVMVSTEGLPPRKNHSDERGYVHFRDKTYFLKRGDVLQKDGEATPSFMQALMRGKEETYWQASPPQGWRTSYNRTALANWITDVDHGAGHLAARVIVNRLWQHHFGRGIVATPSDLECKAIRPRIRNCSIGWPPN